MNVKGLKELLEKYPDELEILTTRMSDYIQMAPEDIQVIKAVPEEHWVMRSHPTMNEESRSKEQSFLYFEGI